MRMYWSWAKWAICVWSATSHPTRRPGPMVLENDPP